MTFPISPNDPRIHVFSVSDGPVKLAHQTYLSRLGAEADGTPLEEALGATVDATYVEVFAVRDVDPMGLRAYLTQAHDIPDAVLSADAARLDGLSGDVVVLAPRAVEGVEALAPPSRTDPHRQLRSGGSGQCAPRSASGGQGTERGQDAGADGSWPVQGGDRRCRGRGPCAGGPRSHALTGRRPHRRWTGACRLDNPGA